MRLILLSTPLGNLQDMTLRVKHALEEGQAFFVEDTRLFFGLMRSLGIATEGKKVWSWHDHNQEQMDFFLQKLEEFPEVFLLSDAGSPIISDPAYPLIKEVLARKGEVDSYSAATAPVLALELSGLPANPFYFFGFLPRQNKKREEWLRENTVAKGTYIVFESPHRLIDSIDFLYKNLPGDTPFVVARELSKKFQEVTRFALSEWGNVKDTLTVKGEFVLLFYLDKGQAIDFSAKGLEQMAEDYLNAPKPRKISKLIAEILGKDAKEVYRQLSQST